MNEVQIRILQTIADIDRQDLVSDESIAESLGAEVEEIQDHLRILEQGGFVSLFGTLGGCSASLTAQGRLTITELGKQRLSAQDVQMCILHAIASISLESFVSDTQIAEQSGLRLRQIKDHLKLMEDKGFLHVSESPDPAVAGDFLYQAQLTPLGRVTLDDPDYMQPERIQITKSEDTIINIGRDVGPGSVIGYGSLQAENIAGRDVSAQDKALETKDKGGPQRFQFEIDKLIGFPEQTLSERQTVEFEGALTYKVHYHESYDEGFITIGTDLWLFKRQNDYLIHNRTTTSTHDKPDDVIYDTLERFSTLEDVGRAYPRLVIRKL